MDWSHSKTRVNLKFSLEGSPTRLPNVADIGGEGKSRIEDFYSL